MRVVFTSNPLWGHVNPLIPLARAFVDRGDDVLWATADDARRHLEAQGFTTTAAGLTLPRSVREFNLQFPEAVLAGARERLASIRHSATIRSIAGNAPNSSDDRSPAAASRFPPPTPSARRLIRAGGWERVVTPPMLSDLLPVVRSWQPSLVVHEASEFGGTIAAAVVDIPSVTVPLCCLLPVDDVAASAAAVAPLWEQLGLEPRPYGGSYDYLYLDTCPPSLQSPDLERVPKREPLRPAVVPAQAPPETLPDLVRNESEAPLIFVSFGTRVDPDLSLLRMVLETLCDLDVRLLATTGPDQDPAAVGNQPRNVHVVGFIKREDVLGSVLANCAAAVTHAGAGTMLRALAHGLPQLCLPRLADQFVNAAACENAGAGLALQPGAVTKEAVRAAAERVLSDPALRSGAVHVADEIAHMPPPEEVAEIVAGRFATSSR